MESQPAPASKKRPRILRREAAGAPWPWQPARRGSASRFAEQHALLSPIAAEAFDAARIGVSLVGIPDWNAWHAVHVGDFNVIYFELEHGKEQGRQKYNEACLEKVRQTGERVIGEHAGFHDLFAPVRIAGEVVAAIACGPFARERPSEATLLEGWRWLTGRAGHVSDAAFFRYVEEARSALVLDEARLPVLLDLVDAFAEITGGQGDAAALVEKTTECRQALRRAISAELMWKVTVSITDPRMSGAWSSRHHGALLGDLGIQKLPERVLVALMSPLDTDQDALSSLIRVDEFQREVVTLAEAEHDAVSGRVGRHGVTLLVTGGGPFRDRASDLAAKLRTLGRRHGLTIHVGIDAGNPSIPDAYQDALAAAERAVMTNVPLVFSEHTDTRGQRTIRLRSARSRIDRILETTPEQAVPAFDRFVESVAAHFGYGIDAVRAYLAAALER